MMELTQELFEKAVQNIVGKVATIENLREEFVELNIKINDDIKTSKHITYDYSERGEYLSKKYGAKIITIEDAKYLKSSDCMVVFYYKNLNVSVLVDQYKKVEYILKKAEN